MKIKDFIQMEVDLDIYDDCYDGIEIAFCGPIYLTREGEENFKEVLDYDIEVSGDFAIVQIDSFEDYECRYHKAFKFFYACAGFCSEEEWNKWFVDP